MSDTTPRPDHAPESDESRLMGTAQGLVEKLVKADRKRKWQVRVLGLVVAAVVVLAGLGGNAYFQLKAYTDQKVKNECQSLELLTATPVPQPANPKANPSREHDYLFYIGVKSWEKKDGCSAVK